ncbi:MAG: Xaa-Pro peptidase family protein [Oscillospiraceae bacterium]
MKTKKTSELAVKIGENGLNYAVVTKQSHILYLTGMKIHPGDRLFAAVIDELGNITFVCNRMLPMPEAAMDSSVWYHDCDDGMLAVSGLICRNAAVGLDYDWQYGYTDRLASLRPDLHFGNGSVLVEEMRMVKCDDELSLLRKSSEINDQCMSELVKSISEARSEQELALHLNEYHRSLGIEDGGGGAIISFGTNAVDPHHAPDDTRLRHGDNIVMDFGFGYHGYLSDMTRTVFYREVSQELEKIYNTVLAAQAAALAAIKPGIEIHLVDSAARALIRDAGYGAFFPHRTGHGIGLDVHEPPFVSGSEHIMLRPGMVFSVEPGIYVPEIGGVRIEDLIIVTERGYENINCYSKALKIVG